jgi:hypothetical protein
MSIVVQRILEEVRDDSVFLADLMVNPRSAIRQRGLLDSTVDAVGSCTPRQLQALTTRAGQQCMESPTCPRTCAETCNVTFTLR